MHKKRLILFANTSSFRLLVGAWDTGSQSSYVSSLLWKVCKVHKCAFLALKLWCNVECCIDFESLTRRSIESLALHESFSTNLMQHTGSTSRSCPGLSSPTTCAPPCGGSSSPCAAWGTARARWSGATPGWSSLLHDFFTWTFLATLILRTTLWSWKINAAWRYFCPLLCKSWQMWTPLKRRIICRKIEAFVARFWTPFVASKLDLLYHTVLWRSQWSGVKQLHWFSGVFILDFTSFGDGWRTAKAKHYLLKCHNFDCSRAHLMPASKAAF